MKIKVGIVFGGQSKEREISFAGGRTVYDNLNKSIFEAIPIFVDSFGNFILLNWEFVYKGSIRDFYPPADQIPVEKGDFQIYAESIGDLNKTDQIALTQKLGKSLHAEELKSYVDFVFLCLHGPFGEDGKIQGLFDYLGIPYSGSGILPSAIGIDKVLQKKLMTNSGFDVPNHFIVEKQPWKNKENRRNFFEKAKKEINFPIVIKAASQGSSIGVSILNTDSFVDFEKSVNKSFFTCELTFEQWNNNNESEKHDFIKTLTDIREGVGIPVNVSFEDQPSTKKSIYHPNDLLIFLNEHLTIGRSVLIASFDGEHQVLIEQFIEGKEFSCIVLQNEADETNIIPSKSAVALPPTEIRKGKELFDYRSKYLPGLSRKITPINLPDEQIEAIRVACEKLFKALDFNVYARIDGFINNEGKVFLNDPNTTSGMMPSSFFFHQAAEIGLNPSQFLTYIIRTSLKERSLSGTSSIKNSELLNHLDVLIKEVNSSLDQKTKIAVILGGYSSERHISVESGRNVYEKLSSSAKYQPIPVFLTGNAEKHLLYQIPINVLLKDNADDINEKINNYHIHPVIQKIINECSGITKKYAGINNLSKPQLISYQELGQLVNGAFIALHGRPGEDGAIQIELEKINLPYNGSDRDSSKITINKFETNEILRQNGLLVADHLVVSITEWKASELDTIEKILSVVKYPFIAKPIDDGCSSAVRKIKTKQELIAFAELIFRTEEEIDADNARILHIKQNEEFPKKNAFLIEELIAKNDAKHFLEITGGMLTSYDESGKIQYEIFEASEALVEGEILSLEEKFLAGQGQNITPARYAIEKEDRQAISEIVKTHLHKAAQILNVQGYCRIDAFVRIFEKNRAEVIFVEVNSLPGMTPATCIFHQCALNGYKPYDFIDKIMEFGLARKNKLVH